MNIRDFTDTEIAGIHNFIVKNVEYSELQKLFVFEPTPLRKSKVFIAIYDLIGSVMHYVGDSATRKKLSILIRPSEELYGLLYSLITRHEATPVSFVRNRINYKIIKICESPAVSASMNDLRSAFLVMVEKQTLIPVDQVSGINPETPEGAKIVKEAREILKKK